MPKLSRLAVFLLAATLLTGCPLPADYSSAVSEFQRDSNQLARSFLTLMEGANLVEEEAFIDAQVSEAQPVEPLTIQSKDLLTPDEIKLRTAAVHALADYTCALASLASGKPTATYDADTAKASTSLKALTTQATTAFAKPTAGSKTPDYSGPVSSAVSAIGEILSLIEKHRAQSEIKDSLRKNDPALTALFNMLADESTSFYDRRKVTLATASRYAFTNYASARRRNPPAPAAELLQLSDRIKQYQRETALLPDADPARAIHAFQDAHGKLVTAILAPKSQGKPAIAQLIASIRALTDEMAPLAQSASTPLE